MVRKINYLFPIHCQHHQSHGCNHHGHDHLQMGSWNGLMGSLVNKQTDMVLSALKVDWPIRYVAFDVCVEKDAFYGRIVLGEST